MIELKTTCYIDAPPEKVWDVMANRQDDWWCPRPWRSETLVQERRAGGRSSVTMYGPDGEVVPNEGVFLEWDEGHRWVVTDAVSADFEPQGPFMVGIWQVEPEGEGSRYTASARHWTEDDRKRHEEMGFEQGWGEVAQQLKRLCEAD